METGVTVETVESYVTMLKGLNTRSVIIGFAILLAGLFLTRIIVRLFGKLLKRSRGIDPAAHTMLKTSLRVLLDTVFVLVAANTMGIPITSFVALLSIVGIAISLAVQGTLSNVVGGVIILASHPFSIGDFVEQDGCTGTIVEIGLLHTKMNTPDGRLIFVPNATLQTSRLINYSANASRRIELTFPVSYRTEPARVRSAVMEAAARCEGLLSDPAPELHIESYEDSLIRYTLWAWTPGSAFLANKFRLSEEVCSALRRHSVEFPYPHLQVHMAQSGADSGSSDT